MNGIIVVKKEKGFTSRDVVNQVSDILGIKKIGHTGTLDPLATGVLVLCIGKATKIAELITCFEKEYIASVTLGIDTDTLDQTGNIIKEESFYATRKQIEDVLLSFQKTYMQKVPIYSAVKVKGKKLYEYAREKKEIDLPRRCVSIFNISLIGDVLYKEDKVCFSFKCIVSKGTYIRSLIRDIAAKLGTYGIMTDLNRIRQGRFSIQDAYTIKNIKNGEYKYLSILEALSDYPKIRVGQSRAFKIRNGSKLKNEYQKELLLFVDQKDHPLALYKVDEKDSNLIRPFKMF